MLRKLIGLTLLGTACSAAQAQTSTSTSTTGAGEQTTTTTTTTVTTTTVPPPRETTAPVASTGKPKAKPYGWRLSVSPQWSIPQPFLYDDVTDSTAVSLIFTARPPISDALILSLSAGPSVKLDSDEDDSSGSDWAVGGEIATAPSHGFSFYGSHGYKAKFTEVFKERSGHENISAAGARWKLADMGGACAGKPANPPCAGTDLVLQGFYDWSNASNDLLDNEALNLTGNLTIPFESGVKLSFKGIHARRFFDEQDPVAGIRQRNREYSAIAGVDVAGWLKKAARIGKLGDFLQELTVGYRWSRIDSNIPEKETTKRSPSITLAIGSSW